MNTALLGKFLEESGLGTVGSFEGSPVAYVGGRDGEDFMPELLVFVKLVEQNYAELTRDKRPRMAAPGELASPITGRRIEGCASCGYNVANCNVTCPRRPA